MSKLESTSGSLLENEAFFIQVAVAISLSELLVVLLSNPISSTDMSEIGATRGSARNSNDPLRDTEGWDSCAMNPFDCMLPGFTCDSDVIGESFVCNDGMFRCLGNYGGCVGVSYECASDNCTQGYNFSCIGPREFECLADVFKCFQNTHPGRFDCLNESNHTDFDCDNDEKYDFACGELPGSDAYSHFECQAAIGDVFDCSQLHIFNCNYIFDCRYGHDCNGEAGECTTSAPWEPIGLPDDPQNPGVFSCMFLFRCNSADEKATAFSCRAQSMFSCGDENKTTKFTCWPDAEIDQFDCESAPGRKFHCADRAFSCIKCAGGQTPKELIYYIFQCNTTTLGFWCDVQLQNFDCPSFDCMSTPFGLT